ncbi:DUF2092 domain-containing protein [Flavobacterium sp. PL02]|uniref:DUF2092 domain-containing protein n=1 Tax=Flavobacterium sp. PL02 TaxID=3088354 RepID=UPI002B224639|nr:DUF2092 domain-containing protein [Flavobacterium sp. PL02]MEA9413713.1 DUF2092 domain-containing protein [Flavobacterium sp. PL02]
MNRKFLFLIGFLMMVISTNAQTQRIDSTAVYLLSRTTETMQDIKSCSFTAVTTYDILTNNLGLVKHAIIDKVAIKFPEKMKVTSTGDKGNRALLYNGQSLNYYSYDNNTYATTTAPNSVIETIDDVSKKYGIEFSAADFFYPSFASDIQSSSEDLVFLGKTTIDGKECFHIAGRDKTKSFQFWIANDDLFLPLKMVIIYTDQKESPQFEAVYKDWVINADLPDTLFEFKAPPKATKTKFAPREKTK